MTLEQFHDMFFGPLDKSYCNLFLVFSMLALLTLVITVMTILTQLVFSKKRSFTPVTWMYALIGPLIFYIQNRLLYGMCKA